MMRTSASNPLRIASVPVPGTGGIIGISPCPGKVERGAYPDSSKRDLDTDLAAIKDWGAELLVSLLEPEECEAVGVADLPLRLPPGLEQVRLPIRDMGVPDNSWEALWSGSGPRVRAVLRRGGRVCVHCMGGLGRSGLVAAIILVEFGEAPDRAIARVREARPGAIETAEQERYVMATGRRDRRLDRETTVA